MWIASKVHVVRQNVEHADHLAEDEHAVVVCPEALEELVEQDHLAAVHDEGLEDLFVRSPGRLGAIEQVGVVRGFFEFHRDVEQADVAAAGLTLLERGEVLEYKQTISQSRSPLVIQMTYLRQDVLVVVRLERAHFDPKNLLLLRWQRLDDIALQPTQHESLELRVQILDFLLVVRIGQIEVVRERD